jgi:hypothetical protein
VDRIHSRPGAAVVLAFAAGLALAGPAQAETIAPAKTAGHDRTTPAQAKKIAKKMVQERGWPKAQYKCLVKLWQAESGWNVTAGSESGSYGIPQAYPGSKMSKAGKAWRTNAKTQITWGLGYIKARYTTPCGAWGHFSSHHWY